METADEKRKRQDREKKAADRAELVRLRRLTENKKGVRDAYLTTEVRAHDPVTGNELVLPAGTSVADAWDALYDFNWEATRAAKKQNG